jgi:hypothetical protein
VGAAEAVAHELGEEWLTLPATAECFQPAGLLPASLIDTSLDDWDGYETLNWLTDEEWLNKHPDDPDAEDIRNRVEHDRERYLRWQRDLLGWAIIIGHKRNRPARSPPRSLGIVPSTWTGVGHRRSPAVSHGQQGPIAKLRSG